MNNLSYHEKCVAFLRYHMLKIIFRLVIFPLASVSKKHLKKNLHENYKKEVDYQDFSFIMIFCSYGNPALSWKVRSKFKRFTFFRFLKKLKHTEIYHLITNNPYQLISKICNGIFDYFSICIMFLYRHDWS